MTYFRSCLTGAWDLISYKASSLRDPKNVLNPFGNDCVGRAIFSADGYVSAYIQAANIAPYSSGQGFGETQDELAAVAKRTISYTGPFFLDEKTTEAGIDGKVKQPIEYDVQMSVPPN